MVRTKQTARKATGCKAPRKAFRNVEDEENDQSSSSSQEEPEPQPDLKAQPPKISKNFASFKLAENQTEYSLTRHTIKKPRKFLLAEDDYIVSDGSLLKVIQPIAMPVVQPGYSVDTLLEKTVRCQKFEIVAKPGAPWSRTLYGPLPMPVNVQIAKIQGFVDVYEPVGAYVEEKGLVLSDQARMALGAVDAPCTIIPRTHYKRLPNTILQQDIQFSKAFAERKLNTRKFDVKAGSLNADQVINEIKQSFTKGVVATQEILISLNDEAQLLQQITQRYVALEFVKESENEKEAILHLIDLFKDLEEIKNKPQDTKNPIHFEKSLEAVHHGTYSDILACCSDISQDEMLEIFEKQKGIIKNLTMLSNHYISALEIAMTHHNTQYLHFCIYKLKMRPDTFGQLAEIALNSKLQMKDIKVGVTSAKLCHTQYSALAFAFYSCSKGFIQKVVTADDMDLKELDETQIITITIGACSNMEDSIEIVKDAERLLDQKAGMKLDPRATVIAALLSKNKKVLGYVLQKYKMQDEYFNNYKKYLSSEHIDLLNNYMTLSTKLLELFSAKLNEDQKLSLLKKMVNQSVSNITDLHLYTGDWVTEIITSQQARCLQYLLSLGFCFAFSNTNYRLIGTIKDRHYFEQVVTVIAAHFAITKQDATSAWSQLCCSAISAVEEEKLEYICNQFNPLLSDENKLKCSTDLMGSTLQSVPQQMSLSGKYLNNVCKILQMKLINRFTVSQLTQTDIDYFPMLVSCEDQFEVLQGLFLQKHWEIRFASEELIPSCCHQFNGAESQCLSLHSATRQLINTLSTKQRELSSLNSSTASSPQTVQELQAGIELSKSALSKLFKIKQYLEATNQQFGYNQNEIATFSHQLSDELFGEFMSNVNHSITIKTIFQRDTEPFEKLYMNMFGHCRDNATQKEHVLQPGSTVMHFVSVTDRPELLDICMKQNLSAVDAKGIFASSKILLSISDNEHVTKFIQQVSKLRGEQLFQAFHLLLKKFATSQGQSGGRRPFNMMVNRPFPMARGNRFVQAQDQKVEFTQILTATSQALGQNMTKVLEHVFDGSTLLHEVASVSTSYSAEFEAVVKLYTSSNIISGIAKSLNKQQRTPVMEYLNICQADQIDKIPKELVQLHSQQDVVGDTFMHMLCRKQYQNINQFKNFFRLFDLQKQFKFACEIENRNNFTACHLLISSNTQPDIIVQQLQVLKELGVSLAQISARKALYPAGGVQLGVAKALFEAGCSVIVDDVKDSEQPLYTLLTNIQMRRYNDQTETQEIKKLKSEMIKAVPAEKAIQILLSCGNNQINDQLNYLTSVKVRYSLELSQSFANYLSQINPNNLTTGWLVQFGNKLGIFKFSNVMAKLQNYNEYFLEAIIKMQLKLSVEDICQLVKISGSISDNFSFIITEQNVNGFLDGLGQKYSELFDSTGCIERIINKLQLNEEQKLLLLKAAVTLQPSKPQLQKTSVKSFIINFLRQRCSQRDFSIHQSFVDQIHLIHKDDTEVENLLSHFSLHNPEPAQPIFAEPRLQPIRLEQKDVQLLGQLSGMLQQNKLEQISAMYSADEKNVLYRFGKPLNIVGLRRTAIRCGVMLIRVIKANNTYQLTKRFINLPTFNPVLTLGAGLFDTQAARGRRKPKNKVVFESQNQDAVFQEFQKLIKQKSQQSFEQIADQADSLEGAQAAGFHFYLVKSTPEFAQEFWMAFNPSAYCQNQLNTLAKPGDSNCERLRKHLVQSMIQTIPNANWVITHKTLLDQAGGLPQHKLMNLYVQAFSCQQIPVKLSQAEMVTDLINLQERVAVLARILAAYTTNSFYELNQLVQCQKSTITGREFSQVTQWPQFSFTAKKHQAIIEHGQYRLQKVDPFSTNSILSLTTVDDTSGIVEYRGFIIYPGQGMWSYNARPAGAIALGRFEE